MSDVFAVQIGFDNDIWGIIEITPDGLRVEADDPDNREELQAIIAKLKKPEQSAQDFLNELPSRLGSRVWGQPFYTSP